MNPPGTMALSVFLAVLGAAALHAGWNAIIKIKLDPLLAMTLICVASGVIALPALWFTGLPRPAAWPWVAASVLIHFAYYVSLAEAYRRADMSQIYPIARGTAPLITACISLLVLQDSMSRGNVAGIALLGVGVVLVSLRGHRHKMAPSPAAVGCALFAAATIAAYTVVDGIGARVSNDVNAYAATLFVADIPPLLVFCLWRKGMQGIKPAFSFVLPGLAGGAMSLAAYWIVLWAMTVAPIALVAAVRETSILFGGLIAVFVLKESLTRVRAVSALLSITGLVLMRLF